MAPTARRNDEIEVLRAVAIFFTFFHHLPYYLFPDPGPLFSEIFSRATFWVGVDLFLVISGFVIMQSFLRLQALNFSVGKTLKVFWLRRIFRIWPSAWLWIGIYLLFTLFFNSTGAFGEIQQNLRDSFAAIFQYANFYGLQCWGPGQTQNCGPYGIFWSLSLEEQFYILLPVFVFIFRKALLWPLLIGILIQFFIFRPTWSLGWAIRTDALMWGVVLALLFSHPLYQKLKPEFLGKLAWTQWLLIPLLLALMPLLPGGLFRLPMGVGLLALVCAGLVFAASFDRGYLMREGFLRRILVWVGARSYSLYLIHIIAFRATWEIFPSSAETSWVYGLVAFPLLFVLAELNYRYVETPLRKWGHRLTA
jgi:peptidoglycan/LPS O-acetylase OafA/YrhL